MKKSTVDLVLELKENWIKLVISIGEALYLDRLLSKLAKVIDKI